MLEDSAGRPLKTPCFDISRGFTFSPILLGVQFDYLRPKRKIYCCQPEVLIRNTFLLAVCLFSLFVLKMKKASQKSYSSVNISLLSHSCDNFCIPRFGDVIDCVVMKNAETGRSRGFGFVTFRFELLRQNIFSKFRLFLSRSATRTTSTA